MSRTLPASTFSGGGDGRHVAASGAAPARGRL